MIKPILKINLRFNLYYSLNTTFLYKIKFQQVINIIDINLATILLTPTLDKITINWEEKVILKINKPIYKTKLLIDLVCDLKAQNLFNK